MNSLSTNNQQNKNQGEKADIFDYDKYLASKKPAPKNKKSSKTGKKSGKPPVKRTSPAEIAPKEAAKEVTATPDEIIEEVLESTSESVPEAKPAEAEAASEPIKEVHVNKEEASAEAVPEEKTPEQENSPAENSSSKNRRKRKKKKKEPKQELDEMLDETMDNIRQAMDEALDEDISEIEEISVPETIKSAPRKNSFKRNAYFAVGLIVSVMAVIGFIFSVNFIAGVVKNIADNTAQKNEFAQLVYPLVIIDPASFDSASQLSSETVLTAAIWDIILYGDTDKYPQEYGVMSVPEIDVELHATNLLGTGLVFDHKDLGTAELVFYYDAENKCYNVPVSPSYFPYSPYVETIQRNGDNYSLKVGYVSPHPAWLGTNKDDTPKPDKYMEYVVHKNGNNYTVVAIKEIEGSYIPNPY